MIMKIGDVELGEKFFDDFIMSVGHHLILFFIGLFEVHGSVITVLKVGDLPHTVHFNEGMTVRNKIREILEDEVLDAVELDDNYEEILKIAIRIYKERFAK